MKLFNKIIYRIDQCIGLYSMMKTANLEDDLRKKPELKKYFIIDT
jgi:hypothetical protein